jgi:hypothetical protein
VQQLVLWANNSIERQKRFINRLLDLILSKTDANAMVDMLKPINSMKQHLEKVTQLSGVEKPPLPQMPDDRLAKARIVARVTCQFIIAQLNELAARLNNPNIA